MSFVARGLLPVYCLALAVVAGGCDYGIPTGGQLDAFIRTDHIKGTWKVRLIGDGGTFVGHGYYVFEALGEADTGVSYQIIDSPDAKLSGQKQTYKPTRSFDNGRFVQFEKHFEGRNYLNTFEVIDSRATQAVIRQNIGTDTKTADAFDRVFDNSELERLREFIETEW